VAQQNINVVQPGGLNAYSADPLVRAAIADSVYNTYRPYPTLSAVNLPVYVGVSDYHSMQATLSRQSGAFTYLVAYTLSQLQGTVATDYATIDPFEGWQERDYGVLSTDRTHVLNVSWTWRLGTPVKSGIGKFLLGDWNLSGISTWSTGQPFRPFFSGALNDQMANAWWGTHDYNGGGGQSTPGDIAPTYSCNPNTGGGNVAPGERIWDVSCVGIPAFGTSGPNYPPDTVRGPGRSFHDLTIFKDFGLGGSRRLQLRFGVFNLFNQAYPDLIGNTDVNSELYVTCNNEVSGIPNGAGGTETRCNPQGGFAFRQDSLDNFGTVNTKRGHRVVEVAVRLFF
jgi:hypothetical protein